MRVRHKQGLLLIESLEKGSVFEHEGNLYIATSVKYPDTRECVNLTDGEVKFFNLDMLVKPRLAEVIIMNDVE